MKIRAFIRTCFLALSFQLAAVLPAGAQPQKPEKNDDRYAAAVIDADGRILYQVNGKQRRHPASTTKIMTAYLIFEALKSGELRLDQKLPVSRHAASQERTNLGMMKEVRVKGKKGTARTVHKQVIETITVEDALKGMLVHSANDAAIVFAEQLAGSDVMFAKMMNEKAGELGLSGTHFTNSNGLPDPKQYTTVEDMAQLSRAVIRDFPEFYGYFSLPSFQFNGVTYRNHNSLMGEYPGLDGLKTGYIGASGYNLVASAVRDGTRVVGSVFGAKSPDLRKKDMAELLDTGFERLQKLAVKSAPTSVPVPIPVPVLAPVTISPRPSPDWEVQGVRVSALPDFTVAADNSEGVNRQEQAFPAPSPGWLEQGIPDGLLPRRPGIKL